MSAERSRARLRGLPTLSEGPFLHGTPLGSGGPTLMTIVAARPGLMVSDTLIVGDDGTKSYAQKVHRVKGYLVGCSGDVGHWQRLVQEASWPKTPTYKSLVSFANTYADILSNHIDVLVCTKTAVFEIDGGAVCEVPVGVTGSGSSVARGYLFGHPEDVEGAVAAAIALAAGCGGQVSSHLLACKRSRTVPQ